MAAIIGDLAVRVGADVAGFRSGMAEASSGLDKLGERARVVTGRVAAVGAAAAAAGAAVVAALVKNGLSAVDAQAKLARQLSTTSASLAVVTRAGDLSGASMEQISSGAKRLAVSLGQAESGNQKLAGTLSRLGLVARDVAEMPLDRRIIAVNAAIRDTIPATEQAAVAAQLFGREAGFAMTSIDADAMARAAREVELFGLNLSDVDAARVEMANDAMGQVRMAVAGVSQQLAVHLAPALTAVMRMFTEAAEAAGGLGDTVARSSNFAIRSLSFVINAADGVKRIFEIAAKTAEVGVRYVIRANLALADVIVNGPIAAINALIAQLNKLPGINIEPAGLTGLGEKIRAMYKASDAALQKAKFGLAEVDAILQRPLAGDKFARYVEEAKQAAEEAAKTAAAITGGGIDGGSPEVRAAKEKAQKEEIDREAQYVADRLQRLREANMSELQILQDKQMQEIEAINAGWEQKLLTDESWNVLMQETKQRHEDEMTAIEQKAADARRKQAEAEAAAKQRIWQGALSGLTTLMNSENRKMFEIGKAAAIAQSIISTYTGMTKALELGWPMGPIAAAAIGAQGFAQVASIRSQQFGGSGTAAAATSSNTAAVNAASTPVGGSAPAGGTLTVQGLSAGALLTGDAVAALAQELLDYQRRGGQVVFAG